MISASQEMDSGAALRASVSSTFQLGIGQAGPCSDTALWRPVLMIDTPRRARQPTRSFLMRSPLDLHCFLLSCGILLDESRIAPNAQKRVIIPALGHNGSRTNRYEKPVPHDG